MDGWLFSLDDLRAWAQHEEADVRRWAVSHWIHLFPEGHLEELALRLMDEDLEIQRDVALHLAATEEDRWAPVLLKGFELTEDRARVTMIEALGLLKHPMVVPTLVSALRQASGGVELLALVHALGRYHTEDAWAALAPLLELLDDENAFSATLMRILLSFGRRQDMPLLVEVWRGWGGTDNVVGQAWFDWLGVDEDVRDFLIGVADIGPRAVLQGLSDIWGGVKWPEGLLDRLQAAFEKNGSAGLIAACHDELVRHVMDRQLPLPTWMEDLSTQPEDDYRALIVGAEGMLDALRRAAPAPGRGASEGGLALAGLALCLWRPLDEEVLRDAEDPVEAAIGLLNAPRRGISEEVRDVLVSAPADALPGLAASARGGHPHSVYRVARLAHTLIERDPSVAAELASALVDSLFQDLPEAVVDEVVESIVGIGRPAVEPLVHALQTQPPHDAVFEAMGQLPVRATGDAIIRFMEQTPNTLDMRAAESLTNLGRVEVIDLLEPFWQPGRPSIAAMLRGVSLLQGVRPDEFDDWCDDLDLESGAMPFANMGQDPAES